MKMEPDWDLFALAYLVRMRLPLVQTPPAGTWGTGGSPEFALPESWLGLPLADPDENLRAPVLRYLATFDPAGAKGFQASSGLTGGKACWRR
jgi:winged helix DNA-binding protein